MSMKDLVFNFLEVAKDLHADYVESWLNGKVNDNDFALTIFKEKRHRTLTYKKLLDLHYTKGEICQS